MVRRIHHVAMVVKRLAQAYGFYRDTLGLPLLKEATLADQGVRAALLAAGEVELELIEPLDEASGVGRYLAHHGEGLHHVCFDVPSVDSTLADLRERGAELIDRTPRAGLAGRIAFLHPRTCGGVLVELATPSPAPDTASPLQLKRVVIGAREPKRIADLYRGWFALPEVALNEGPRTMLAAGQSALLFVPSDEVGGLEGMLALSFVAEEFDVLTEACDRAGVRLLRGTGEVTIDPASSHGVHLHISRYWFP